MNFEKYEIPDLELSSISITYKTDSHEQLTLLSKPNDQTELFYKDHFLFQTKGPDSLDRMISSMKSHGDQIQGLVESINDAHLYTGEKNIGDLLEIKGFKLKTFKYTSKILYAEYETPSEHKVSISMKNNVTEVKCGTETIIKEEGSHAFHTTLKRIKPRGEEFSGYVDSSAMVQFKALVILASMNNCNPDLK